MLLARISVPLMALVALFVLPWPVALAFVLAASLVLPVSGIALGIIADLAYFTPGAAFLPSMTLFGLAFCALAVFVHRFVKTRIITE